MSLRKVCFCTMLAAILACAAAGSWKRATDRSVRHSPPVHQISCCGGLTFRPKSEMLPADFLPVQSKNTKSLGAGKLLVASRNLGDPHFAKTVILLARYDAQGALIFLLRHCGLLPLPLAAM
jgi:hypothetical protein